MRLRDDPSYTRLPGAGSGPVGTVQYWRGPDHLLLVEVVGCVERYRRFAFADLVALTIRPTRRRAWLMAAFAVPTKLFLILGGLATQQETGSDRWLAAGLLLGSALVAGGVTAWMFLAGPTCEVRLTTTVQTLVLPGLRRRRGAERFREALLAALPTRAHGLTGNVDGASPDLSPGPEGVSPGIPTVPS